MSDDLVALAKIVVRQGTMINLIAAQLADQAALIVPHLEPCRKCKEEPVTIVHVRMEELRLCDRCAAESIVKSARAYVDGYIENPEDPLNTMRASLMNENEWVDTADAQRIRKLVDYVKIVKELEVSPDRIQ